MSTPNRSPQRILIVSAGQRETTAVHALRAAADRQWPGIEVHAVNLLGGSDNEWWSRLRCLVGTSDRWLRRPPQPGPGSWSGRRLAPLIDRIRPDMVVSTHPLGSSGLHWLRRHRGLDLPTGIWNGQTAAPDNGSKHHLGTDHIVSTPSGTSQSSPVLDIEEGLRRIAAMIPDPYPRSLQGPDALFLHVETPSVPQYVGTVLVFEPGPVLTRRQAAELLSAVPGVRDQLCSATLVRRARWVPDTGTDPLTLVDQTHTDDLTAAVDDFFSQPLHPQHTVGAARLVTGLPEGRRALLVKLHHALGDGVSVLQALLSDTDGNGLSWARRPETRLARHRFRPRARLLAQGLWWLARAGRAPRTGTDGTITSSRRRHELVRLPGRAVRQTARALDISAPEVLLTVFTEALNRVAVMSRRNTFRLMVPSSVRGTDSLGTTGNHTGALPVDLPLGPMTIRRRARLVAQAIRRPTVSGVPEAAHTVMRVLGWLPPPLHRAAARRMYRRDWFNAIGTILPGPRREVRWRTAVLSEAYPILALAPETGLAWGAMTWGSWITMGFTGPTPYGSLIAELGRRIPNVLVDVATEAGVAIDPEEVTG